MNTTQDTETHTYKIGAVAKMTGIAPETLRIWERRYSVVTPERTPAGGRLYKQDDVTRLALIKKLVDAGDSISSVAGLTLEELQERAARAIQTHAVEIAGTKVESPCRVVIYGETLGVTMQAVEDMDDVLILDSFSDQDEFTDNVRSLEPDVLVIEIASLHEESANQIIAWLQLAGAVHAIVIYRYGNTDAFRRIPASKCSLLRAPVDPVTIQRHCQSFIAAAVTGSATAGADIESFSLNSTFAEPRRYNDETLARVAMQSTAIKCECPRHLTELIASLAAFEQYSTECESRSPEDAALHAYLNTTASRARVMIENALTKVIEAENIEI